jgi:hypothetical protein
VKIHLPSPLARLCCHSWASLIRKLKIQTAPKSGALDPVKKYRRSQVPVAHTYNPSYLGGRDWEDCGFEASLDK